jgi:hypothetical protein
MAANAHGGLLFAGGGVLGLGCRHHGGQRQQEKAVWFIHRMQLVVSWID